MIKEYIPRNFYLNKINPFIDQEVIKVIVGQRRVGKSYFLFQIMDEIKRRESHKQIKGRKPRTPNFIYINKELDEFKEIKDDHDLISFVKTKAVADKKNYLFIDEIQDIKQFEKALRSLHAKGGYDIYCTGSNAHLLSGELATYLSGRGIEIEIYSLSYLEFLQFHHLENSPDALLKYIKYGGLPYLIHLALEDDIIYDYLKNIYNAILFRDIIQRYHLRNSIFLEQLIQYVADNTGSLVSAKRISDFLKSQKVNVSTNVILDYLSYLCASFFLFKIQRRDVDGKKIFEINEKYYFEDLGLRHAIVGYKQTDMHKILENLVLMHLKTCGFKVFVGKLADKEIDFVAERGKNVMYVQVVYLIPDEKVKEREFGNLLKISDNYPKLVVSMDEMASGDVKGIEHMHIRDFLSQSF